MVWDQKNAVLRRPAGLQVVGQAFSPFIDLQAPLAAAVRWQGRIPITFGPWPLSEFRVPVRGWYLNNAQLRVALPKDYMISLSLEVMQGNLLLASVPILFGGVQSKVVAAGSDDLNSDDWCAANGAIPAGATGWLRYDVTVATAGILSVSSFIGNMQVSSMGGSGTWFATTGAATGNVNAAGPMPAAGGTAVGGGFAPLCLAGLLGKYDYQRTSMFIIGNSRDAGVEGMQIACINMNIPVVNFGYSGTGVIQWAAIPLNCLKTVMYCTDVFIGDPINDLRYGTTLADAQAAYTTLISRVKSVNPNIRIWGKKCLPHTTSTDAWATVENQAPSGAWSAWPGSARDLYNTWIDTLVGTSLFGVLDPCVALEAGGSGASGKWIPLSTTDGLHEINANYVNEAVLFGHQLLSKGFIPNTGKY
jgi:hypothetical protein